MRPRCCQPQSRRSQLAHQIQRHITTDQFACTLPRRALMELNPDCPRLVRPLMGAGRTGDFPLMPACEGRFVYLPLILDESLDDFDSSSHQNAVVLSQVVPQKIVFGRSSRMRARFFEPQHAGLRIPPSAPPQLHTPPPYLSPVLLHNRRQSPVAAGDCGASLATSANCTRAQTGLGLGINTWLPFLPFFLSSHNQKGR